MQQLQALYNEHYFELTDIERSILDYTLENMKKVSDISITDLAKETLTSKSSVLRLTQKIGFTGFTEFKYFLADELRQMENKPDFSSDTLRSDIDTTERLFLQSPMERINELIHNSNQIFCYGTGMGQKNVLRDFQRNLITTKKFTVDILGATELRLAVEAAQEDDIVIILSLSGNVQQLEESLTILKAKKVKIIGITQLKQSLLTNFSDYSLYFQVTPRYYKNKEIISFLPIFYLTELIFESYFEYYINSQGDS